MTIQVDGIRLEKNFKVILDELSTSFPKGLVTGVVGPNGSGKSSLLRILYGYLPSAKGSVLLQDKDLRAWDPRELARQLGVCPQEAEPSLDFKVEQVLALRFGGQSERLSEGLMALEFLRLEELFGRTLSQLSGGEKQRVRLGTALLGHAPWLLLDEPANHLDLATAWSLFEYLKQQREGGVILALHNLTTAARYCGNLLVLHEGRKVAQGSPREVLTPQLLGEIFRLEASLDWNDERADLRISGVTAP